jgi:hypothetical protein
MKRCLSLAFAVSMAGLLVACGSDSPSAPQNLSANISGNWSGQTTMFGLPTNVTVAVSQATSDPSLTTVEPLTGTVTLDNGTPLSVTGTKQGNSWTVSGNAGATIATIHQTLTSAAAGTGDFTLQVGPPSNKGTVVLNLQKS